jgi:hypothetical protein
MGRTALELALLAALDDHSGPLTHFDFHHATWTAKTLNDFPDLALVWGQVLTEHTAPDEVSNDLHAYSYATRVGDGSRCIHPVMYATGAGICGESADAPVHR